MKRSKKWFAIVLTMLLSLNLLLGCGAEPSTVPTTESRQSDVDQPASAAAPELDDIASSAEASTAEGVGANDNASAVSIFPVEAGTDITLYTAFEPMMHGKIIETPDDFGFIKFLEKNTGVDILVTSDSYMTMTEKMNLLFASGDYYDIYNFDVTYYHVAGGASAIENDIAADLSQYIEEYAPDYYELLTSDIDRYMDSVTETGAMPAFMMMYEDGLGADTGMVVRQDWLDKLDMEVPVTYDDFHEMLLAFRTELGKTAGPMWFSSSGSFTVGSFAAGYGLPEHHRDEVPVYIDPTDGMTAKFSPFEDGYYDYLCMIRQWYEEGLIYHEYYAPMDSWGMKDEEFATDEIGLFTTSLSDFTAFPERISRDYGLSIELSALRFPVMNEGDTLFFGPDTLSGAVGAMSIAGNSDKIELACQMINLFYTEEGTTFCNFGEEGVTYTVDENGDKIFTDLILNNPSGMPMDPVLGCYSFTNGPFLCTAESRAAKFNEEQLSAAQIWGDFEEAHYTLAFDDASKERYNAIQADVLTYMLEMTNKFIIGDIDLNDSTWDSYLQELDQMGASEMVELAQEAYNRSDAIRADVEKIVAD